MRRGGRPRERGNRSASVFHLLAAFSLFDYFLALNNNVLSSWLRANVIAIKIAACGRIHYLCSTENQFIALSRIPQSCKDRIAVVLHVVGVHEFGQWCGVP